MKTLFIPLVEDKIKKIFFLFNNAGIELRLVGGIVRDTLLGLKTYDIDCAVACPPEKAFSILKENGFVPLTTGIKYGTLTLFLNSFRIDITSLRDDIETDGRYAKTSYHLDWAKDARRRDFTINALYANLKGEIFDPLNQGLDDLKNSVVRFIGDPEKRIREDFLRVLRYYRFLSYFNHGSWAPAKNLSVIQEGLKKLSKERIRLEFLKILESKKRFSILKLMKKHGILNIIFPESDISLLKKSKEISLLGGFFLLCKKELRLCQEYLPLSRPEKHYLFSLQQSLEKEKIEDVYIDHGKEIAKDWMHIAHKNNKENRRFLIFNNEKKDSFPLSGIDLLNAGFSKNYTLKIYLKKCEKWWIQNNRIPQKIECLAFCKNYKIGAGEGI